jgi:hypothetical protein
VRSYRLKDLKVCCGFGVFGIFLCVQDDGAKQTAATAKIGIFIAFKVTARAGSGNGEMGI